MAADEKKTPKPVKEKAEDGSWVVIDDQLQVLAVERAELRAWRMAGRVKAVVVKWPFGKTRAEMEPVMRAALAERP